MNKKLQDILDIIQQSEKLDAEQKENLLIAVKDADKELEITAFKLERTEKVKKTTAILLEETIEELELKRKAVEEQNRELEIETSLEKVRTIAMGMRKPDDMLAVCKTISLQLESLGVKEIRNVQTAIFYKHRGTYMNYQYYAKHNKTVITDTVYTNNKLHKEFAEKMLKGKGEYFISHIEGKKVKDWIAYQKTNNVFIDEYLETASSLNYYWFSLGLVALGISTYHPLIEEKIILFKKFLKVFELAYRRYLDIEKAEAQAKEAQIQLALERVRARTMAMHNSEELSEVAALLFEQLTALGIQHFASGFSIFDKVNQSAQMWLSYQGDITPKPLSVDFNASPVLKRVYDNWKEGKPFYLNQTSGKEFIQHIEFLKNVFGKRVSDFIESTRKKFTDSGKEMPNQMVMHHTFFTYGSLILNNITPVKEQETLNRFAKVFEQTYTRFLDLQKAEAQARESQIEASLERVRARAMAMHKSDELLEAGELLYKELSKLGIVSLSSGYVLMDKEEKIGWNYGVNPADGKIMPVAVGIPHMETKTMQSITTSWKSQEPFLGIELNPEETIKHQTYIAEHSINFPISAEQLIAISPEKLVLHTFNFKQGYLLIVGERLLISEQLELVVRFTKVFEMTYRRFLDLQKAEAQAREAKIEASLEKVRTVALTMKRSDEMLDIAQALYEQLLELGFSNIRNAIIDLHNEKNETFLDYDYSPDMGRTVTLMSYYDHPIIEKQVRQIESSSDAFFEIILEGQDLQDLIEMRLKNGEEEDPRLRQIKQLTYNLYSFGDGAIGISNFGLLSEEHKVVLKRFRNVFAFAYKRYKDMVQAETQAREAQIEAALERVRTRSIAMHQSNELKDVVRALYKEFRILVTDIDSVNIQLNLDFSKDIHFWASIEEDIYPELYHLQYSDLPIFEKFYNAFNSQGDGFFDYLLDKEEKDAFFSEVFKIQPVPHPRKKMIQNAEGMVMMGWFHKHSGIDIVRYNLKRFIEEEKDIVKRFAAAFEQTYIRFLDLQKAEAQAKEAIKQASLDRVRGEIASMRTSEDLNRITPVIWHELKTLDVPFIRCGVFIVNEDEAKTHVYLSTPDGKALGVLDLAFEENDLTKKTVEHWKEKIIYKEHWNKEQFINWTKSMMELGQVQNVETYQGSSTPPESLDLHFVPFTQGMLYVGDVSPLTDEKLDLVKTLAEAFSIAYARYEDFKNLEDAKNKIELTLKELKSTQVQLIHSEKMASLGELTAGIAHEIKNPLNFVNNFSEISRELLDEIEEELEKNDKEEVLAILNDLKQNLEKINQHGKRADSIVKGMLQHSRGSSGEKTLTDINDLLDQYVNLAYHGMRAQNKEFNIAIEKDYDKTLEKINVVPQDLSRVFLNIINNGCYAAYDRKKKGGDFNPVLKVSTKNLKDKVEIRIADNGNGIPSDIIDKIFQPFFTTKPTGEGTGLGLSLSYDIVTKVHGGELKVETKECEGSEFIIKLPNS